MKRFATVVVEFTDKIFLIYEFCAMFNAFWMSSHRVFMCLIADFLGHFRFSDIPPCVQHSPLLLTIELNPILTLRCLNLNITPIQLVIICSTVNTFVALNNWMVNFGVSLYTIIFDLFFSHYLLMIFRIILNRFRD